MEEEEKKENINLGGETGQVPTDFGKVIDTLHNKNKLSSLRTYQGDTAEFIRSKNESVISIATKEKVRDDKRKEKIEEKTVENLGKISDTGSKKSGFQMNVTMILLSLFLVGGGIMVSFYLFKFLTNEPAPEVSVNNNEIISSSDIITLTSLTKTSFESELSKLSYKNGLNIIKISDAEGKTIQKSQDFLNFLEISLPATLARTLKTEYAIGAISAGGATSLFFILTVNDFGRAFSGMLTWEEKMIDDLSFLNVSKNVQEVFVWKDLILKNKDIRAFANPKNQAKIAYTFLDKNTILIVNDLYAIDTIFSIYISRAVAR